jgi:ABC-type transport system involved in cytochrome c biogenesis permease subunit
MFWINFNIFAIVSLILWLAGVLMIVISGKRIRLDWPGRICILLGIISLLFFAVILWINLERPPMRTLGETRLWYTIFLSAIGIITYFRWKYKVLLIFTLAMAVLFIFVNWLHPETYDKTLMPALQSPWFIPHVIVYILSYAILAFSSMVAAYGLFKVYTKTFDAITIRLADNLVYIGFAFLTMGLLFGALWAKEAWGHYWTWDPKETWAFLTWLSYLLYIHFRIFQPGKIKTPLWALSLAFIVLLICWFGVNYLPSAENSVHVYAGE